MMGVTRVRIIRTLNWRQPLLATAVTIAVAVGVFAANTPRVHAAGNEFRSLGGIAGSYNYIYHGWHSPNTSLDLHPSPWVNSANVYFQVKHISGTNAPYVEVLDYGSPNGCTGYKFRLWEWTGSNWVVRGDLSLLHINKASISDFYLNTGGYYTIYYAGTLKNPEPSACWTGEHLHQEGTVTNNSGLSGTFNVGDSANWIHKVSY